MKRRQWLQCVSLLGPTLVGCAGGLRLSRNASRALDLPQPPGNRAQGTIVVFMPESHQTREVWTGLADELHGDFRLVGVRVETVADAPVIAQSVESERPDAVVLMNNPTVSAYREFQKRTPEAKFPPAVVVMTSFLEETRRLNPECYRDQL